MILIGLVAFKAAIDTIKVSEFLFSAVLANSFHSTLFLMSKITLLINLFFCKINFCIRKSQKEYLKYYFYISVSQYEDFLKELSFLRLILERKTCYAHFMRHQG